MIPKSGLDEDSDLESNSEDMEPDVNFDPDHNTAWAPHGSKTVSYIDLTLS
jgi:hypothetical protein